MLASWLGCYGVKFIIAVLGSLLRELAITRRLGALAAVTSAWLVLLAIPLHARAPDNPLNVRLVQANSQDEESLFRFSQPASGFVPDVIIWPEYSLLSDPAKDSKLWARLQAVPRENHACFIFGAKEELNPKDEAAYRNTAFVMDREGAVVGRHYKNHPVHFIRDGIRGTRADAIPTTLGRIGAAICFDMDYPDVARRLAQDGAEVLLVPNDDPPEWGEVQRGQHRLMFQMRAAECGKWLARADVAGGTSVAAPNGQEAARIGTTVPGRLDVTIGRNRARTLYVQGGWLFGPACLALAGCLVLTGILAKPSVEPVRD